MPAWDDPKEAIPAGPWREAGCGANRPELCNPGKVLYWNPHRDPRGRTFALSEVDSIRCRRGDPDGRRFAIGAVHGAVQSEQRDGARGLPGLGQRHHVADEVRGGARLSRRGARERSRWTLRHRLHTTIAVG